MRSIRSLIFVLFFLPFAARAEFAIQEWGDYSQLTSQGKKSILTIQGRVKNLEQNQRMTAFSFGFALEQKIKITAVSLDGKDAQYDFSKNVLKVSFPGALANNQLASIKIFYEEEYEKINEYLRQELVYVPSFAAGAFATIVINFSGYDLTTYHLAAVPSGNSLTYASIVPADGIKEVMKFTPNASAWDVEVKAKIIAQKELGEFSLKAPTYFNSPRQKVSNYSASFSKNPALTDRKGSDISYVFRVPGNEFEMVAKAKIFAGAANRHNIMRNMIDYSKISQEEMVLVAPLLQEAKTNKKYAGMPLYVAIGQLVNDYLKYDKSYSGKLPGLSEIIKGKVGVCTEFARLYDAMARAAGIPSLIIDGGACGEYNECQGHSWNMIFYNNRWIEVDPTWNLMSGAVSSSHVYVSDGGKGEIEIKYRNGVGAVKMAIDLEMHDLDKNPQPKIQSVK